MSATYRIRPYRPEDAADLFAAARESIAEVSPWLPWCHQQYSMQEASDWARSREELARQGVEYNFVVLNEHERFLGGCGINQIKPIHRLANLGYWVRSSEAGQGVAPRAVSLVARFAFMNTALLRLEILCAVGNERSQRVAEKAGAVREGTLADRLLLRGTPCDAIMYSIVRSRWEAAERPDAGVDRTVVAQRQGSVRS